MLITRQFAWAHLPKAAGAATQQMLEAVPGMVEWADSQDTNAKHDPFWRHTEAVAGKLLVMNIRRLPSWILSIAHHRAVAGTWPDYEPQPMPTVEEMVESPVPDDLLRYMTDGARYPVDRWLRMENLTDDVIALLEELGVVTEEAAARIAAVPFGQGIRPRRRSGLHAPPRSSGCTCSTRPGRRSSDGSTATFTSSPIRAPPIRRRSTSRTPSRRRRGPLPGLAAERRARRRPARADDAAQPRPGPLRRRRDRRRRLARRPSTGRSSRRSTASSPRSGRASTTTRSSVTSTTTSGRSC